MTIALLFPGQGATHVDRALRFGVASPRGRALLERAAHGADIPLGRLVERAELLDRTEILQPVLTAISCFVVAELEAGGVRGDLVVGHSLGEIAAWSASGAATAEAAVDVAALRGRRMAEAASRSPGGLVALATSDPRIVGAVIAAASGAGALHVVADNAPDETVLGGDEAAVRRALAASPVAATRVPTSGPWHAPSMASVVAPLLQAMTRENIADAKILRFVTNRDGSVVEDAARLPGLVAEQAARPVAFRAALATTIAIADDLVTIGPGAVVRSLVRKNLGERAPRVHATDDARSLAATLSTLGARR